MRKQQGHHPRQSGQALKARWARTIGLLALAVGLPAMAGTYTTTVPVPAANGKPATKVVCTMTTYPFRTILTALNKDLVAADTDILCAIPAGSPGATSAKPTVTSTPTFQFKQGSTVLNGVTDTSTDISAPNYNGYTYRAFPATCTRGGVYYFYKKASASIAIWVPYSSQRVTTSLSSIIELQALQLNHC